MNKIKLVYDVVKVLKEKDNFNGTLKAEVRRDEVKIFDLTKEFGKNTVSGEVKCKINTELNYEGKVIKHESNTEFNISDCCEGRHHGFKKNMHKHCHPDSHKCCSIKDRLSMVAFLLNAFNNMKVEEKENKAAVLSINIDEFPEDMKNMIKEKLDYHMHHQKEEQQCCCMKELCLMEDITIDMNILVNSYSEIEKVELLVKGKHKDEASSSRDLNLKGELSLNW